MEIRPQPGFQEKAISCTADIAIIGGSAGGGKTWSLMMEPLKYVSDSRFGAVYFRRIIKSIRAQGGLWDESQTWYPLFDAKPLESVLKWKFPSGASVTFGGIEYEKDLAAWQGTQIPLIIFDELTEFTKKMFFFLLSRNRGVCNVRPYVRASCNPDPDSWLAEFISWWIDQNTGFPIKERDGVVRYMTNYKDQVIWGDSADEVVRKCPDMFKSEKFLASGVDKESLIKSVTFIAGDVYDNKILLKNDPGYLGSLNSMSDADQARFLGGNWKIRSDDMGLYDNSAIENLFLDYTYDEVVTTIGFSPKDGRPIEVVDKSYHNNYITCDAAKFGRDLCVIMVWKKWTVVYTVIYQRSTPMTIKNRIEELRVMFQVPKPNTLVDQDGVGGDVVKLGRYYGFSARREVAIDETTKEKENYKMRKDQCYFKSSARVNSGELKIIALKNTVEIWDAGSTRPRSSCLILHKGEMTDVKVLIKNQLRAIKRGKSDFEGGALKLCTNSKDEQKEILGGDSPDFADTIMMREDFDLSRRRKGTFKVH